MSTTPTPPPTTHKLTQPPWLRILYEVSHEVHAIKMHAKKVPETVQWVKKFTFWGGNRLNFKLKHRKAQKSILCGRFGHLYGRAGGKCRIRESWHICSLSVELGFSIPFVGADSGFLGLNSGFQSSGFLDSTRKTLLNSEFQEKNFPTIEIQVMLHVHRASSS